MDCDQLLAMDLDLALDLCRAAEFEVNIEYTAPPKGEPGGRYRVVRCKKAAEAILLVAAREVERKGGVISNGL